jgi:hypothetical protein
MKGQLTESIVQFVYAPPIEAKELRSLQVPTPPPPPPTARHSLFGECNCAGAQLLTRLHTDATRCGLNITCARCSRFPHSPCTDFVHPLHRRYPVVDKNWLKGQVYVCLYTRSLHNAWLHRSPSHCSILHHTFALQINTNLQPTHKGFRQRQVAALHRARHLQPHFSGSTSEQSRKCKIQ